MCSAPWAVVALIASLIWIARPSSLGRWGLGEVVGTWGFGLSAALLAGTALPLETGTGVLPLVPALAMLAVPSAGFVAAAAYVVRGKYRLPLARLGLRFDHPRRRAAEGVVGAAAAIAASVAGQKVTVALLAVAVGHAAAAPEAGRHGCLPSIYELLPRLTGNLGEIALAAAVVGLAVPIGEEILFRGLALGALRQMFGRHVAVALSALVFAAAHLQPTYILSLAALGVVLGYLYEVTGSLVPGMVAHSVHNLFMLYFVQLPRMYHGFLWRP